MQFKKIIGFSVLFFLYCVCAYVTKQQMKSTNILTCYKRFSTVPANMRFQPWIYINIYLNTILKYAILLAFFVQTYFCGYWWENIFVQISHIPPLFQKKIPVSILYKPDLICSAVLVTRSNTILNLFLLCTSYLMTNLNFQCFFIAEGRKGIYYINAKTIVMFTYINAANNKNEYLLILKISELLKFACLFFRVFGSVFVLD